ncbi:hypothetical protein E3U26_04520 [Paracoccus ferrooxidans]|nr:hypothetical protein E3U26_04520 [Paracoccus ferrooxidans]
MRRSVGRISRSRRRSSRSAGSLLRGCARGIYDNMKTAVDTIFVGRDRACNRVRLFSRTAGVHRLTPADMRALSGRAAVPGA